MSIDRAAAPERDVSAFAHPAYGLPVPAARLFAVGDVFARFGAELERLARRAEPSVALTFSRAWWEAVPPPRGYAHRLLVLHRGEELCAAVSLRERIVLGLPTGIFQGSDAKGEGLVLCAPGEERIWLQVALDTLMRMRRCTALLLNHPHDPNAGERLLGSTLADGSWHQCSRPVSFFWQTVLCPRFEDTLAAFGHRTRRNLRHAYRRVAQNGWHFLPELSVAQIAEATTQLASRSTHPYPSTVTNARLLLESSEAGRFSMGLRTADGEWMSLLSGMRRPGGVTDVFWQANAARAHHSMAMAMRALLMRHEGERGTARVRYIGGTSPLMEHCCRPDLGVRTLIMRRGVRSGLLRQMLRTPLLADGNPMRLLLQGELGPSL